MPVVELTTIGRRSGRSRTSLLTSPMQVGDGYVIVASRGGDDVHPAWFLNLRANPEVQVRTGRGPARTMTARVAVGTELDGLWRRIGERKPHYLRYQERTSRPIPLVILTEASD
jgi:deazaflavin-dependent oxidoreductase (nitroreductase family)